MNISAPPTSRGNSTASRASSLTAAVRPDPRTFLPDISHMHHNNIIRPPKIPSANTPTTGGSLLRYSSNDSTTTMNSSSTSTKNVATTPKNRSSRSHSLTLESGKKLDEFINNVKQNQLPSKSPGISKSGRNKSDTPNASDKKRLVKQFYEDSKSKSGNNSNTTNGTSTPVRGSESAASSSSNVLRSPISTDLISQFIFQNNYLMNEELEEALVDSDVEEDTIDKELVKLKSHVVKDVKTKVKAAENSKMNVLNLLDLKQNELKDLNAQLKQKYEDSQPQLIQIHKTNYSMSSKYNNKDNVELDRNLNELDTTLQKYREIISEEKSLMGEIDQDLEFLEKKTLENYERLIYNRNKVAALVVLVAVCYLVYVLH